MSEFDSQDYYPILCTSIRPGHIIPFDCYILLERVNRIVRWVSNNNPFPEGKFEQLKSKSIKKVYILNADRDKYFSYLDSFLQTPEGQETLELIRKSSVDAKEGLEGIPSPEEFNLKALNPETDNENIDVSPVTVTNSAENPLGKVTIKEQQSDKLITYLKDQVNTLERNLQRINQIPSDEKQIISDATLHITDELKKIVGSNHSEPDFKKKIEDVTQILKDEIIRISGVSEKYEEVKILNQSLTDLQTETDVIKNLPQIDEMKKKDFDRFLNKIIGKLSPFSTNLTSSLISEIFGSTVEGVEDHLGQSVILKSHVGRYEEVPEYVREMLSLKEFMQAKRDDVKLFQHQIVKQNIVIKDLQNKSAALHNCHKSLYDKWFVFYIHAKKILDPSGIMSANEVDEEIKKLEKTQSGVLSKSASLLTEFQEVSTSVIDSHTEIDTELLKKIGALPSPSNGTQNKADRTETEIKQEHTDEEQSALLLKDLHHLQSSQSTESQEEIQALKDSAAKLESENHVLKSQIENLEALVNSVGKKGEELELILNRANEYSEKLEIDNKEKKETIESLEKRIQDLSSSQMHFDQTVSDLHKQSKNTSADQELTLERLTDLTNQLNLSQLELNDLRKEKGWDEVSRTQNEQLQNILRRLEAKQEELNENKKTLITLNSKLQDLKTEEKRLTQKVDQLTQDQENKDKQTRTLLIKFDMNNNLLKQSQQSVNKLTQLTDQIRQERQTYIRQTNEALNKYKAMTEKANLLGRQVTAGEQSVEELQQKLKRIQERELQLRKEAIEWRTKFTESQKEIKVLQREIDTKKTA